MGWEDIQTTINEAKQHFEGGRLEKAHQCYEAAETAAKAIIEDSLDQAPELVINAYFIDVALGIGDTLLALGRKFPEALIRYFRIKDYPFPENPVPKDTLWLKLVTCCLAEGDEAFRRKDLEAAEAAYHKVLVTETDEFRPARTELYDGYLDNMPSRVSEWLNNEPDEIEQADARDFPPDLLVALSDVKQRIEQLDSGLNYLGYPESYAPIFSFDHLQDLARGFAKFAAQANREYVNFRSMAENETQTQRQFEQAVTLNQVAADLERSRASVVEREIEVASDTAQVARDRARRAEEAFEQFRTTGWQLARLQAAQAWAGSAVVVNDEEIEQSYRGLEDLGISSTYARRSNLLHTLSWEQARRSYALEVSRSERAKDEMIAAVQQAEKQRLAVLGRRNAARLSVKAARWRHRASIENLSAARSEVVSAELSLSLSSLAKHTAEIYLSRAIEAAFLMQQAYNLERSTKISRIRLDYGDLNLAGGLYAADLLLRDIDEFSLQAIAGVQFKSQTGIKILSLKKEFPRAFYDLLTTGEAQFETELKDFYEDLPGTFDGRIKRVRVIVDGSAGPDGVAGMLTCAGTSLVRRSDGESVRMTHSSETLILPRAPAKLEINAPARLDGQLEVFEHVGVATSWNLRLPLQWNAMNLKELSNVKIVVAYSFRHDPTLERKDLTVSAQEEVSQGELLVDFRKGHKVWWALSNKGKADISIGPRLVPPHHSLETVFRALIFIILRPDGDVQETTLRLSGADGVESTYTTGADGIVTVATELQPGPYGGTPLMQKLTLELPRADNPTLFSDEREGADLSDVYLIQMAVEYEYKLRRNEA